jgi:hypothetical protein
MVIGEQGVAIGIGMGEKAAVLGGTALRHAVAVLGDAAGMWPDDVWRKSIGR